MYCRTCGNKMNDNAEICVKCGVRRNVGNDFCQVCGAKTTASMANCSKCGAKLMKSLSSAQVKKKAVSKGRKVAGNVCFVLGIILIFAMIANLVVMFGAGNLYYAGSHGSSAGICAILGGLFIGIGRVLRKKK